MKQIKIGLIGGGKAGTAVLEAFFRDDNFSVVCLVDARGDDCLAAKTVLKGRDVRIFSAITDALSMANNIDYFVDFSTAEAVWENAQIYINSKTPFIMCASGLNVKQKQEIESRCRAQSIKGAIVPNASTLSVLGMYFDKIAAPFVRDIIISETHDVSKADAPSGTAYNTLVECARAKGYDGFDDKDFVLSGTSVKNSQFIRHLQSGIEVHAKRPQTEGVTTQVVELYSEGQRLTLEHIAYNRQCYKKGIELAITYLEQHGGFLQGLEVAMGLA